MLKQEIINQIITLLVIPALPAVTGFVITWFRAKTEYLNRQIENEKVKHYILLLEKVTSDVVASLSQTTVDELKKKSSDGKLTQQEAKEIKQIAKEQIIDILGDNGCEALGDIYKDLEKLVSIKIEAEIKKSKV
jgi:hypothetical protein